jgi:hypothetical protein
MLRCQGDSGAGLTHKLVMSDCRLYLITPPSLPPGFAKTLALALDAGDVACLQLRLKDAPADVVARAVEELMPIAQARDVAFILNDDAQTAARLGCDGAHLGQGDGDHAGARMLLDGKILGITCHASRQKRQRLSWPMPAMPPKSANRPSSWGVARTIIAPARATPPVARPTTRRKPRKRRFT